MATSPLALKTLQRPCAPAQVERVLQQTVSGFSYFRESTDGVCTPAAAEVKKKTGAETSSLEKESLAASTAV